MILHWHRRDLRPTDNSGLAAASDEDRLLPVFVVDPDVLSHAGAPRVAFMLASLDSLRAWYRERGSDLVVVRGAPQAELVRLAGEHGADRVVWNRGYSGLATTRDTTVADALSDAGIDSTSVHDLLVHEPGSITTTDGGTYQVYSYFWRTWREKDRPDPHPAPTADRLVDATGDVLPTLEALGFDLAEATVPPGGFSAARDRLEQFCTDDIYRYEADRDAPAKEATSRLSPHLKWGTIGPRTVLRAVERAKDAAANEAAAASCDEFASQLAWREFYVHVLAANPQLVDSNVRSYSHPLQWRNDPEGVRAWKRGETGFPIVDAGMRQLRDEAFMHNRVRMIVASFLTKDLLVDWRVGYAWFRECLVDHDTANDAGGWQWAASTGTDAQPYFRIFNPTTQGERYDPDAAYIRDYVPELAETPTASIHGWGELDPEERRRVAPDYPDPILDHAARREATLEMFQAARGED